MSRKAWWKEALEPAAELVVKLYESVEILSDPELAMLLRAAVVPGQTNCGWMTYEAARLVRPIAEREQRRRRYLASREALAGTYREGT